VNVLARSVTSNSGMVAGILEQAHFGR